jgi:hypothetical protein
VGAGLTEGSHSFTVRVTDDAGNKVNDTTAWSWHVDLPPTVEVAAVHPAADRALVTQPFDVRFAPRV